MIPASTSVNEPTTAGPDDTGTDRGDGRVFVDVGACIEWLCAPDGTSWDRAASSDELADSVRP